ncbi:hypothetical protein Tsubulata_046474 [Turnera subulata]|uniref:Uncharacterized protein n=1 Tax=Turnera subulata TaxID=218843 RepID=A0A9Q0G9S4_9ROSI|nr:hypothetical protein Tsubulata_046474 [Turnera subulata]
MLAREPQWVGAFCLPRTTTYAAAAETAYVAVLTGSTQRQWFVFPSLQRPRRGGEEAEEAVSLPRSVLCFAHLFLAIGIDGDDCDSLPLWVLSCGPRLRTADLDVATTGHGCQSGSLRGCCSPPSPATEPPDAGVVGCSSYLGGGCSRLLRRADGVAPKASSFFVKEMMLRASHACGLSGLNLPCGLSCWIAGGPESPGFDKAIQRHVGESGGEGF